MFQHLEKADVMSKVIRGRPLGDALKAEVNRRDLII